MGRHDLCSSYNDHTQNNMLVHNAVHVVKQHVVRHAGHILPRSTRGKKTNKERTRLHVAANNICLLSWLLLNQKANCISFPVIVYVL